MTDWLVNVSPADAKGMIDKGEVVLIDVREVGEFATAQIAGASLHPLSGFDASCLPDAGGKPVLFQCAGGVRSAKAAEQYRAHTGCEKVMHLEGGLGAWAQAGLPVKQNQ